MFPNRLNLHPRRSTTGRKAPAKPRPLRLLRPLRRVRPQSTYDSCCSYYHVIILSPVRGLLFRQEKKVTFRDDCKAEGTVLVLVLLVLLALLVLLVLVLVLVLLTFNA